MRCVSLIVLCRLRCWVRCKLSVVPLMNVRRKLLVRRGKVLAGMLVKKICTRTRLLVCVC